MTPVLVDTNVILDVATGHPIWSAWSDQALARLADETILVVNPLIYAEVSVRYETVEEWAFPCHPAARPRVHGTAESGVRARTWMPRASRGMTAVACFPADLDAVGRRLPLVTQG